MRKVGGYDVTGGERLRWYEGDLGWQGVTVTGRRGGLNERRLEEGVVTEGPHQCCHWLAAEAFSAQLLTLTAPPPSLTLLISVFTENASKATTISYINQGR